MAFDSVELLMLYEIVTFPFAGSDDELLHQVVEKCTRLFGARRLALDTADESAASTIRFWGFRSAADAMAAAADPSPNALVVRLGDKQLGYLYVDHALQPGSRDRRLYEILARRIGAAVERRLASSIARRSEFEKAVILDSIREHVAFQDSLLRIRWANRAAAGGVTGVGADDLIGKVCYEAFFGTGQPCAGCPVILALDDGNAHEATLLMPDGTTWYTRAYPVKSDDGVTEGVVKVAMDITGQLEAEQARRSSEEQIKVIFNSVNDAIFVLNSRHEIATVNNKALEMFGVGRDEATQFSFGLDYSAPSNPPGRLEEVWQRAARGEGQLLEWKARRPKDGRHFDAEIFVTKLGPADGNKGHNGLLVTVRDISERKGREEFLRDLFDQSPIGMYIAANGLFRMVNAQMEKYSGLGRAELIGRPTLSLVAPEDRERVRRSAVEMITGRRKAPYEFRLKDSHGATRWVAESVAEIPFNGGRAVLGNVLDITERKESEQALLLLSLQDQVTGLYSRYFFEEELHRLKYGVHYPITILSGDVDGLRLANDSQGHKRGDDLLRAIAEVLRRNARPDDVLARVGGDEFAAILPRCDACEAEAIAGRIRTEVETASLTLLGLPVSISLGWAVASSPAVDLGEVLKSAESHMYRDKLSRSAGTRSQIVSALLAALGAKDYEAQGHVNRVGGLCRYLGRALGLSPRELADLSLLAKVHDLGKVGIPDAVLQKVGELTADEWEIMRQHSEIGYRIASASADLVTVARLVLHHHEHWDGSGYPMGLRGCDIPIECRVHLLADAYDAMTNDRPYRKACSRDYALAEIRRGAGRQFDPQLAGVLLRILDAVEIH